MIESPCIGICTIIDDRCIGCHRKSHEIKNWLHFSVKKRKKITKECLIKMNNVLKNRT